MQQPIRTIHVYFEEEELPTIDADPEPEQQPTRYTSLGLWCGLFFCLLCIAVPIWATFLSPTYANTYDTSLSRTLTLQLSLHPTATQVPLDRLPVISKTEQVTVTATGSIHQDATKATGLITFFNGSFSQQFIPAGTRLTSKDGIAAVTAQNAYIPPATATTPPTYGTVSVTATSTVAGSMGNIAASDINQACCGASVLAQNLYPFTGGQDARDVPVLAKTDIASGTQTLTGQVSAAMNDQAQREMKPGLILLPLNCSPTLTSDHQPGDEVSSAILTLKESCTPLAYFAGAIAAVSQHGFTLPQGYHLVSFTALVLDSHTTATEGTLTVQAIAYLKQNTATVRTYHFAGK
jgi:hypothetical protein